MKNTTLGNIINAFIYFLLIASVGTLLQCSSNKSSAPSNTTTFYFVRHAEKADDGTKDPPLLEVGKKRALKLAGLLKNEKITAVYSTNYKRTKETAAPTAKMFNLDTKIYDHKTIDMNELAKTEKGKSILIVGHSNSTPTLTNKLIGEERFEQFDESDYGNILKVKIIDKDKKVEALKF